MKALKGLKPSTRAVLNYIFGIFMLAACVTAGVFAQIADSFGWVHRIMFSADMAGVILMMYAASKQMNEPELKP